MKKKAFLLYSDISDAVKELSDEAAGQLFKAIFFYVDTGEPPNIADPTAKVAFAFIKSKLDADAEKYEEIAAKRQEAGRKGGEQRAKNLAKAILEREYEASEANAKTTEANEANAKFAKEDEANEADNVNVNDNVNNNDNIVDKSTKKTKAASRFTSPSIEEVREYCLERGNNVSPEQFYDHYTANGWKQSGGVSIKDWKAAVRTWERNSFSRPQPTQVSSYSESYNSGERKEKRRCTL